MSHFKILTQKEKQQIVNQLNNQFGISEIPNSWIIAKTSKEKILAFSGEVNEKQIKKLSETAVIEGIGLYIAKIDENTKNIRLSIEGTQLFKEQITKNIFQLNEQQLQQWMTGNELNIQVPKNQQGFLVIKYKDDFLGSGKASENKISNFIPKERRIRS